MKSSRPLLFFFLLSNLFGLRSVSAEEIEFVRAHDLIRSYCVECHNPADEKGSLDLAVFESEADFLSKPILLEDLEWVIAEKEMPPPKAEKQPTAGERKELVLWLQQELMKIQNARPNDPGPVVMPRISSKEFDYIVEDLTGESYELSQFLTSDTAAGEGFYNVGAGQQLSVGQFEGFMSVGKMFMGFSRYIPGHGIWWMNTSEPAFETDDELGLFLREQWADWHNRKLREYIRSHIREIQRKTPFDALNAYLEAAWRYQYRTQLGYDANASIAEIAADYEPALITPVLEKVIGILGSEQDAEDVIEMRENPFFAAFIQKFLSLPAPTNGDPESAREELAAFQKWRAVAADSVFGQRSDGPWEIKAVDSAENSERRGYYDRGQGYLKLDLTQLPDGVLYLAASGETYVGGEVDPIVIWSNGTVKLEDGREKPWNEVFREIVDQEGRRIQFGQHPNRTLEKDRIAQTTPGYLAFKVPEGAKTLEVVAEYDPEQEGKRFLRVKPLPAPPTDYFYEFKNRKKMAGGLDDVQKATREHGKFSIFDDVQRARFRDRGFFVDADPEVITFLGMDEPPGYGEWSDRPNRWGTIWSIDPQDVRDLVLPDDRADIEHLQGLILSGARNNQRSLPEKMAEFRQIVSDFAEKAWRQAPEQGEIAGLTAMAEQEISAGASSEEALETAMRAVLISPKFLYRFTESRQNADPYALQSREIATRLAAVLWVGLPDEELYALADSGRLNDPGVLSGQIDRMLADPRADRFIEEFFGRWLHFAEFDSFGGPDQEKFKEWDKNLARAMHQEATLFLQHLVREDQPLTDLFYADYTFLNNKLAEHYGINGVKGKEMRLVRIEDAPRGGILGMGAFLTGTSTPLRTSPVHRGLWLYEDVLDLPVPEPPPVPLLSDDGVDDQGRTIVDQLRQHRDDPACYSCHDRFDPMGVALENFDPIGRWRTQVEGKADVKSQGLFRSGETIDGIEGLRHYLAQREDTLLEAFTTKLLGYSLGRSVLPTDRATLQAMQESMRANGMSPRSAIHAALTSPQFLQRRDLELATR